MRTLDVPRSGHANAAERLFAALVAIACAGLLSVAATLTPDPAGLGTHTQLGLPPDPMLEVTGVPMPTCGMTTSWAWFVRGELLASLYVQPLGALLAATAVVAVPLGLLVTVTGRPLHRRLAPLVRRRGLVIVGLLAALSWAWKVSIHLSGVGGWPP